MTTPIPTTAVTTARRMARPVRRGATGASSVAPRRVRVTQSLVVEADAVPAGETVRAWIPYPRAIPGQQDGLRLHATTPAKATVAPEDTRQRTVYLEQRAVAGQPTRFAIDYELTVHAQVHAIDPDSVVPVVPTDALAEHLGERPPHIVFSDEIRAFSARVVLHADSVNTLYATSISRAGIRSNPETLQVVSDTTGPTLNVQYPRPGESLVGTTTDILGIVADALSGVGCARGSGCLSVSVNGIPADVTSGIGTTGTFVARGVALSPGSTNVLSIVATDGVGNATTESTTWLIKSVK